MQIKKIVLKNFRSVGTEGLELHLSPATNTFIGENNVGKSSIFEALKILKKPSIALKNEDWHRSDQTKTILFQIECILDDQQIKKIIEIFELPYNENQYKKYFSDIATYSFEYKIGRSYLSLQLGFLQIEDRLGYTKKHERDRGSPIISWENVIKKISLNSDKISPFDAINIVARETIRPLETDPVFGIDFQGRNVSDRIKDLLMEKIIIIDEFRERPDHVRNDALSSATGKELANVLNKLKNSRPITSKKFDTIKTTFNRLYPDLDIEVIDEENNIRLLISKGSLESTTLYMGSGILQTLLLITHLIAHNDKVLCIDTPETYLHPHAQRRLGSLIESSKESQLILITHSQYFLELNKQSRIFRFIQKEGAIQAISPDDAVFNDDDYNTFKKFLDIDTKEFILSRKVILVEGQSEQWVLPIFASSLDFNFDEHGVSIISVNGKNNFKIYVKLLEGFCIPWCILADNDATPQIDELKMDYPNLKAVLLKGTLEEVFPNNIFQKARSEFNNNKSLVAKEAARLMVEQNVEIPLEIKNLISQIQ